MSLHLGIIYKNGIVVNHRSLLKVVLNPLLRLIGFQIVTCFSGNEPGKIGVGRCPRVWSHSFKYDITDCMVEKKRRVW
jgi:hypothetical protein